MNLHTINVTPTIINSYQRMSELVSDNDSIVLIENAVLAGCKSSAVEDMLLFLSGSCRIFALETDVRQRGVDEKMLPFITLISVEKFVELSVEHAKVISWD